jgi:hypothetical protein
MADSLPERASRHGRSRADADIPSAVGCAERNRKRQPPLITTMGRERGGLNNPGRHQPPVAGTAAHAGQPVRAETETATTYIIDPASRNRREMNRLRGACDSGSLRRHTEACENIPRFTLLSLPRSSVSSAPHGRMKKLYSSPFPLLLFQNVFSFHLRSTA